MKPWEFVAFVSGGRSMVVGWLWENPVLQARVDTMLRRLRVMPFPWPMPYYRPLGDGIGEIRINLKNVEHRIYGYGTGGQFVMLCAGSDKKKQQEAIKEAKKLRKQIGNQHPSVEAYDV